MKRIGKKPEGVYTVKNQGENVCKHNKIQERSVNFLKYFINIIFYSVKFLFCSSKLCNVNTNKERAMALLQRRRRRSWCHNLSALSFDNAHLSKYSRRGCSTQIQEMKIHYFLLLLSQLGSFLFCDILPWIYAVKQLQNYGKCKLPSWQNISHVCF